MVDADRFHREHAVVELAIRDLKEGTGLEHIPSGHFHANAAWLGCSVLAHNIGIWATMISGQPAVTEPDPTHTPDRNGGGDRKSFRPPSAAVPDRLAMGRPVRLNAPPDPGAPSTRVRLRLLPRDLTHPRQAQRRQPARNTNAFIDAPRPPVQPVPTPTSHPTPDPSQAKRWIEA